MSILLITLGVYNFLFAIFHIFFWKLFRWKSDLKSNFAANRAIIQILNILAIYLFIVAGLAFTLYHPVLMDSDGGQYFVVATAGFWTIRFFLQFIFFSHRSRIVQFLTFIFLIGVILHILPFLMLS